MARSASGLEEIQSEKNIRKPSSNSLKRMEIVKKHSLEQWHTAKFLQGLELTFMHWDSHMDGLDIGLKSVSIKRKC